MFFHCHPTKKLLCMLPLLQVGRTTQAVHLFTFEAVVSGVEGEDRGGGGARHSRNCLVCISSVPKLKRLSVLGTFESRSCFFKT